MRTVPVKSIRYAEESFIPQMEPFTKKMTANHCLQTIIFRLFCSITNFLDSP